MAVKTCRNASPHVTGQLDEQFVNVVCGLSYRLNSVFHRSAVISAILSSIAFIAHRITTFGRSAEVARQKNRVHGIGQYSMSMDTNHDSAVAKIHSTQIINVTIVTAISGELDPTVHGLRP